MKKIIVAVIIIVFIPISFVGAEDKGTVAPATNNITLSSKAYLPLPAKDAYYIIKERMAKKTDKADFLDCIEGKRRTISYGRMNVGNEETKPNQGYHSNVWVTIKCGK